MLYYFAFQGLLEKNMFARTVNTGNRLDKVFQLPKNLFIQCVFFLYMLAIGWRNSANQWRACTIKTNTLDQ